MPLASSRDFSVNVSAIVNLNEQSLQNVQNKIQTVLKSSTQNIVLNADGKEVVRVVNTLTDKFKNLYQQVQDPASVSRMKYRRLHQRLP